MENCWRRAAEEDAFSGRLEQRIIGLDQRMEFAEGLADRNRSELHEEIQQVSNEVSMTHDCLWTPLLHCWERRLFEERAWFKPPAMDTFGDTGNVLTL